MRPHYCLNLQKSGERVLKDVSWFTSSTNLSTRRIIFSLLLHERNLRRRERAFFQKRSVDLTSGSNNGLFVKGSTLLKALAIDR